MRLPQENQYSYLPTELINEINNNNVIFFVGSNFLDPPRYEYISELISSIQQARSISDLKNQSNLLKVAAGGITEASYIKKKVLDRYWPAPGKNHDKLARLRNVRNLITTLFDENIEKAFKKRERQIEVLTAVDSLSEDFMPKLTKTAAILFKLIGNIKSPQTLRISSEDLYELRSRLRESTTYKNFLISLIEHKVLVNLGYSSKDLYDNFFREVVNELQYSRDNELLRQIYFVDQFEYDSYYGTWEGKNEQHYKIIDITPSEFLGRLIEGG